MIKLLSIIVVLFVTSLNIFSQNLSIIWPNRNEVISDRTPLLSWNGVEGASNYQVSLSLDSTFTSGVQQFTSSITTYQLNTMLSSGTWFWKVNVVMNGQNYVSNFGKFIVFEPSDISSLSLWLRADSNVVLDANGKVQEWKDLSAGNLSFNQNNSTKRPSINQAGLNSMKSLIFNGSQSLSGGDVLDLGTSNRSIFIIANSTNSGANGFNQLIFSKALFGAADSRFSLHFNPSNFGFFYNDNGDRSVFLSNTSSIGQYYLLGCQINRSISTLQLFRNQVLLGSNSNLINGFNMNSPFRFLIGAYNDATDQGELLNFYGNISEIVFINSVNTTETNNLNKYLMDRYAPPVNLGADITPIYQNNGTCVNETIIASSIYTNFLWSTGAITQSIQVVQPGSYWVQTTDIFGRISRDTILVNNPKMSIFNFQDTIVCFNDALNISPNLPPNHSFTQWQDGNLISNRNFDINNVDNIFSVFFTSSSGCLINSNSFQIKIDSTLQNITLGADTAICSNNLIQVSNSPQIPLTYLWNTSNTNPTQLIQSAGQYWIQVFNGNGCNNSDTIQIGITGEGPMLSANISNTTCIGTSITFSAQATISPPESIFSYDWHFGNGSTAIGDSVSTSFLTPGTTQVQVSVTASNGCEVVLNQNVQVFPNPSVNIISDGSCLYDSVNFSTQNNGFTILNYEWDLGQNVTSTSTSPSYVYNTAGSYQINIIVTDQNGCIDTSHLELILSENLEYYSNSLSVIWPKRNEVISDRTPLLSWNGVEGASNYQLSLSLDSTFTSGVQQFTSSITAYQLNTMLSSGTWFWKVNTAVNEQNFISNLGKFYVFEPTDISSLCLWLRADTNVVLDANGKVQQWIDLSSSASVFSQNIQLKRPILSSVGLNSKPMLTFNGAQVLSGGNILNIGTNSRSMFMIGNYNNTSTNGYFFAKALFGASNSRYGLGGNISNLQSLYIDNNDRTAQVNPGPNFSNPSLFGVVINRQNNTNNLIRNFITIAQNSTLLVNHNMNSTFRFLIGAYNDASDIDETLYLNGNISEVVFANTEDLLTRIKLSNYLMDRYAPPVNLGADITPTYQNNGTCVNETITASSIYSNYLWSNGASAQSIQVTQPGSYWVQTTDIFGRISRDTILVNNPKMSIFNFQDTTICFNEQTSIFPSIPSGLSLIKWNNCNPNLENEIKPGNAYFIEMINNQGCLVKSNVFTVTVDSSLYNISLGADTALCSGNNIQLQNPPAVITDYAWNTGNAQSIQTVDTSGLYILEITNTNNCQNRDTIQVQVIGTSPTLQFSFSDTLCQFSPGSYLDISFVPSNNGTISSKTWSISEGTTLIGSTGNFSIDTSGVFDVTLLIETQEGCSSSTTFPLLIQPKPSLTFTTQNYCPYEEIVFTPLNNSSPVTLNSFLWNFNQNNNTSTISNPSYSFGQTGTYNVSLQAQDINGCRDTITQAVYIQPAPLADFSFNNTCEETTVNFVNNSNILDTFNITTNAWSYGDGTQVINPSLQKVYADADTFDVQLIVTANNGCQDTSLQSIIIYPRPTLEWQVGPACKNTWTTFENLSSVSIGNIAQTDWLVNLQYQLEGFSSAYQFVTTGVQYLNLTSTTDNGCQRDTLIIVNVQPEISASYFVSPQTIVAGVPTTFTSTSTGANQYTWTLEGSNPIQTSNSEPVEIPGFDASLIGDSIQASLIIENSMGCRDTASQYIKVYEPRIDLAINQLFVQDINGFYKVGVELRNLGFVEITQTDLLLKLYNSSPILETETESLAPGESRIYLFNANPSAFISTQDNEISYLCVEATSYNYYQLIETELSNNISCLNTEGGNFVLLPIYPNPTNNDVTYTLIVSEESTISASLTDETGRIVQSSTELFASGLHTPTLSMRNLSAGVYYFQISDGVTSKTVKVLKN
ncbi:MAG: PKD domain-containing protein [Crocinitomicaceae bacterium]|nr:PKD domain-containing protein [Crocinitomicaceae bacterium]MCF8409959.1 PKD domain-containing protein [Crocinitomicaceae bacterium]MCF8444842.1 PKD domain-containing protein [Crocinitomicaceae bacterium]